jgi:hypothetical protein
MLRSLLLVGIVTLSMQGTYGEQSASPTPPQDPAASPAAVQPSAPSSAPLSTTQADPKKRKKLWTNENLSDANGPISVVGNAKSGSNPKASPAKAADPNYAANVKKQLDKLQGDIDDTDKQIVQLKNFSQGEPSPIVGVQAHKGYDRDPVDVQIRELQEKKKQLQDKMTALFDEARKKGVEPGQLR